MPELKNIEVGDWVLVEELRSEGTVREDRVPYCARVHTATPDYYGFLVYYHELAGSKARDTPIGYSHDRYVDISEIVAVIPKELVTNYNHKAIQLFAALNGVKRWELM